MTGNIWKSYMCTAVKKWDMSDPRSNEHYWTKLKWDLKKIQVRTGFEPVIFPVIVHHLEDLFASNIITSSQLAR